MTETTIPARSDFADLYASSRADLYRALVLLSGDRDAALDAVDHGYAKWLSDLRRHQPAGDQVVVFGAALDRLRKRAGSSSDEVRGFRLRRDALPPDAAADLAAFRELAFEERAALVVAHRLQWPDVDLAIALGLSPDDAQALRTAAERHLSAAGSNPSRMGPAFAAEVGELSEPLERAASVRRAASVKRLGKVGVVAIGFVIVAAVAIVGVAAIGRDGDVGTTSSTDPQVGPFEWVETGLPFEQGDVTALAFGAEGFVLVGTDYSGRFGASAVLFSSKDGFTWEMLGQPPVNNGWVQSIDRVGDRFVAAGSSPGPAGDRPTLWVSEDGSSWTTTELPVEDEVEIDGAMFRAYTWISGSTLTPDGMSVFGTQSGDIDLVSLIGDKLPEGVTLDGGWGSSDLGVEFYDDRGQVSLRVTWEELDVSDELVRLITGTRVVAWHSADGADWEIDDEAFRLPPSAGTGSVFASVGDRYAALTYGSIGTELWLGSGDDWHVGGPDDAASITALTSSGGVLYAAGSDSQSAAAVWSTSDGETWQRAATAGVQGQVNRLMRNGEGVVAIVQRSDDVLDDRAVVDKGELRVEISRDGIYRVFEDGEIAATTFGADLVEGDDGSVIIVGEDGEELVELTRDEITAAWQERDQEFVPDFAGYDILLLASEDGREWETIDVTAGVGTSFFPIAAVWRDGTAIVAGARDGGFIEGGSGTSIWVGTRS